MASPYIVQQTKGQRSSRGKEEVRDKMKQLVAGILAHVDAGKTTLSEGMLYISGTIRRLGRVDKKDAFLDTYRQERERGITIFSKQARLIVGDTEIILLDTPGHVDFAAEMERTLQVLDVAVLVVSASDGVQGHTLTLWRLLEHRRIPVFLFVNKMDQPDTDAETLLVQLKEKLSGNCVNFSQQEEPGFYEDIAVCGEEALDEFLETGKVGKENIQKLIGERKLFPCFFGSALKLSGVEGLLKGLSSYLPEKVYRETFGARVFKISRDGQGNRLTHMKITGGCLKAKDSLVGKGHGPEGEWEEKVNQIRVYSGERFEVAGCVQAGGICTVTGLSKTFAGEGLGFEEDVCPELSPVLCYSLILPQGLDAAQMLPKLKQLEEEEPQLHITWDERSKEIKAQIMGQVQTEILKTLIEERFGVQIDFGSGSIVYRETIANTVEGVGHFEPLRHYAEVHLLLEPGEPGSGLVIESDCSRDVLAVNWQRLILSHLEEKEHPGVLLGAPITDMKITLKSGRAHLKHTEGGDFRQATYRALRQGLMQAESILLEPYYDFILEIPESAVGRAMTDLDKMHGTFQADHDGAGVAQLIGMAPMAFLQEYQKEVNVYTKGLGKLSLSMKGYYPCHNTEEILAETDYDPLQDVENPACSVFCAHGAGFIVEWDQVPSYMHLESCLAKGDSSPTPAYAHRKERDGEDAAVAAAKNLGQEEIEAILERASYANKRDKRAGSRNGYKKSGGQGRSLKDQPGQPLTRNYGPPPKREEYLLVDGYNVIFAWEGLKELAERNLDGARGKLLDILCNYQAIKKCSLIVVFDAYRLAGHPTEILDYHNIHVVYTREAETADQYIEKFAHENSRKYDISVATSDGLEQIIILGEGCRRISSRELKEEIEQVSRQALKDFQDAHPSREKSLGQVLTREEAEDIVNNMLK